VDKIYISQLSPHIHISCVCPSDEEVCSSSIEDIPFSSFEERRSHDEKTDTLVPSSYLVLVMTIMMMTVTVNVVVS
jgi:hypothetical protein